MSKMRREADEESVVSSIHSEDFNSPNSDFEPESKFTVSFRTVNGSTINLNVIIAMLGGDLAEGKSEAVSKTIEQVIPQLLSTVSAAVADTGAGAAGQEQKRPVKEGEDKAAAEAKAKAAVSLASRVQEALESGTPGAAGMRRTCSEDNFQLRMGRTGPGSARHSFRRTKRTSRKHRGRSADDGDSFTTFDAKVDQVGGVTEVEVTKYVRRQQSMKSHNHILKTLACGRHCENYFSLVRALVSTISLLLTVLILWVIIVHFLSEASQGSPREHQQEAGMPLPANH